MSDFFNSLRQRELVGGGIILLYADLRHFVALRCSDSMDNGLQWHYINSIPGEFIDGGSPLLTPQELQDVLNDVHVTAAMFVLNFDREKCAKHLSQLWEDHQVLDGQVSNGNQS